MRDLATVEMVKRDGWADHPILSLITTSATILSFAVIYSECCCTRE